MAILKKLLQITEQYLVVLLVMMLQIKAGDFNTVINKGSGDISSFSGKIKELIVESSITINKSTLDKIESIEVSDGAKLAIKGATTIDEVVEKISGLGSVMIGDECYTTSSEKITRTIEENYTNTGTITERFIKVMSLIHPLVAL